jgi:hypothetical protein
VAVELRPNIQTLHEVYYYTREPFHANRSAFRPSVPIVPPFGTPSVIHCKSTCRMEIYKYFRKTIKMLWLILSVYVRVYVLEREN